MSRAIAARLSSMLQCLHVPSILRACSSTSRYMSDGESPVITHEDVTVSKSGIYLFNLSTDRSE
jgi:hypothetical protein